MLKTREFVRNSLQNQLAKNEPLLTGALLVIVHFRIPAPLSQPGKKRALQNLLPHIKKPDGDNLEKFLNDSLNGLLWDDDARIAWLVRSKSVTSAKEGSTIIFVKEIPLSMPVYDELIADIIEHIKIEDEPYAQAE